MKTTIYIGTSLDGFIARNDGDIEWLVKFQNQEVDDSYQEFISKIDVIVIGRGTYEKVITFPSWFYEQKVYLLSTTIKQVPDHLREKVTILSMEPRELINYLANEGFSNIYVDGGKVIQSFLKEDCIDEMVITKVPEVLGRGIPLFGYLQNDLHFKHIRTEVFSNGLVKSHYERDRE
ncbi:dihydrofolate reductase family protein [Solitalea sp. MAHUQ-68]|uniref:Dihydrofolate reductase family protein n=1 Tax=Solitalea agri TaxID=2953739 RepID=A0A9X2F3J1_9SPHI|nr:dihydrofolate reductase family protein [Solitalea agri]MCO4293571.1 dihydrofolate reductase family protein [Solitalea agri]